MHARNSTEWLRRAGHVVFLALAFALVYTSTASGSSTAPGGTASSGPGERRAAGGVGQPHQAAGTTLAGFDPVRQEHVAQSLVEPGTAAPDTWLQTHRPTTLWPTPSATAAVMALPQWQHLRPVGPIRNGFVLVEEPGDGISRLPLRGWVAQTDVGPSGPPAIEWHLATSYQADTPRWAGSAWPQYVTAEFAVVLDSDSGRLLYGKNAHGRVAPASLTKIATALVALERSAPWEMVDIKVDARTMVDSTVMGLLPGQRLSMNVLLYGLMLPSGNDAALAVAEHVGGSEAGFVQMMNELTGQLGLKNTHFANPHGLDATSHYSSPYDMAVFARYAMRHPTFARLAGSTYYEAEGYQLYNMNRLLWSYEGADGVKPGYTDLAGRAVVASATRNGHRVYVVLMRSPDLWGDAMGLLDWSFRNFDWDD